MVDINNRNEIFKHLYELKDTDNPKIDKLTPQHMVEHLWGSVIIYNGKKRVHNKHLTQFNLR